MDPTLAVLSSLIESIPIAILNFQRGNIQSTMDMWIVPFLVRFALVAFVFIVSNVSVGLFWPTSYERFVHLPDYSLPENLPPKFRKPPDKIKKNRFIFSIWLIVLSCFLLAAKAAYLRITINQLPWIGLDFLLSCNKIAILNFSRGFQCGFFCHSF